MKDRHTAQWKSSQEMSKENFEIHFYRDKYFKTVEMHSHDFYEIYCFLGGAVDYIVEDGLYHLQSGDVLLIPPNYLHQPRITDESIVYSRLVLWINSKYLKRISSKNTDLATCFNKAHETGSYLIKNGNLSVAIIQELYAVIDDSQTEAFGNDISAENHIRNTLTMLGAHYLKNPTAKPAAQSKIVSMAIEYIGEHLCDDLSLDLIAKKLYLSKYYFAHLFKEETGISPHGYILKKRLLLSKELIESGLPITEVFSKCGFGDYSHFFRTFKQEFNMTPKQYFYMIK